MPKTKIAELFKNGSSQAVRLPAEFRFEGRDIYVTRDEVTGDVVLSDRPGAKVWRDFFEMMRFVDVPDDFMDERPMNRPLKSATFSLTTSGHDPHARYRYIEVYHQRPFSQRGNRIVDD